MLSFFNRIIVNNCFRGSDIILYDGPYLKLVEAGAFLSVAWPTGVQLVIRFYLRLIFSGVVWLSRDLKLRTTLFLSSHRHL